MKSYFYLFILLGVLSACQTNTNSEEVVCETIHTYGVPLAPQEWSERGQCGQVISKRKDGVTVTRNYDAGVLHGECFYSHPFRETIQKKEVYDRGTLKTEVIHYPTGVPQKQIDYDSNNRQLATTWFESGAPHSSEEIEGNQLIAGEYYAQNQQLDSRVEGGNGFRTKRGPGDELISVDTIQDGKMTVSTTYHSNGLPKAITPYVEGVIHGERRTYLHGGEPSTIETWKNNVQNGNTILFEHGEKRAELPYVDGVPHGIERRYQDDGKLIQEVTWVKGQKHGPAYTYLSSKPQTDWYFKGQQVPNKATFEMMSNQ